MKRPTERLDALTEELIQAWLAKPLSAEDQAFLDAMRDDPTVGGWLSPPQPGEEFDEIEARRIVIEIRLGLDRHWPPLTREDFVSDEAYRRYLAVPTESA